MNPLVVDGIEYEIKNFSINGDIDSYTFDWSAELENYQDYLKLNPQSSYIECSYNLVLTGYNGTSYNYDLGDFILLIESAHRNNNGETKSYTLSGRGKNALLDSRYNEKANYSYANVSAQTTVNNLCAAAGISLSWLIDDWIIPAYEANNVYPIDVIKDIAEAKKAAVQPKITGGLSVIYRNKQKPTILSNPDYTFNEDDILSVSESYEDRAGYDFISVGNENDSPAGDLSASIDYDQETRIISVSVYPFQDVNIFHSMQNSNLQLDYLGTETKLIEDEIVTIIDGKANLSNNYYGTVSSQWIEGNLGTLTIAENGELSTATIGNGLLSINYNTKYHKWLASPFNNIEMALVWVEAAA
jgi:hypothetical protein